MKKKTKQNESKRGARKPITDHRFVIRAHFDETLETNF